MRKRDKELNAYWGTNCPLLEMTAKDGKKGTNGRDILFETSPEKADKIIKIYNEEL